MRPPEAPGTETIIRGPDSLPKEEFTGERYVPGVEGEIELEHLHRYAVAVSFCTGKRVLDVACGTGYGSFMVSQVAGQVVGLDIDAKSVIQAKARYPRDNLRFAAADCSRLPCESQSFDVVLSFETLEHIEPQERFLQEIKRVIKPGGLLIMSSPDRERYAETRDTPNPFHVKELSKEEFRELLMRSFRHVRLGGQRLTYSSLLAPENGLEAREIMYCRQNEACEIRLSHMPAEEIYLLAFCSDSDLAPLPLSLFEGTIKPYFYSSLKGGIAERDTRIVQLSGELAKLEGEISKAEDAIGELYGKSRENPLVPDDLSETPQRKQASQPSQAAPPPPRKTLKGAMKGAVKKVLARISGEYPLFSADFYLRTYPDVAASGMNPLVHYLRYGAKEGRSPHPLFDAKFYRQRYLKDTACDDALQHYLKTGWKQGYDPHPLFDSKFYIDSQNLPENRGVVPLTHFLGNLSNLYLSPCPFFHPKYYFFASPDVAQHGFNAFYHFVECGLGEGRRPHPLFDTDYYRGEYPEVRESGVYPFVYYVQHGRKRGHRTNFYGASFEACETLPALEASRLAPHPALIDAGEVSRTLSFSKSSSPKVSIVIPVYNKVLYTLRCLKRLTQTIGDIECEVIVVDDCSTDRTAELLRNIPGLTLMVNEKNLGFLRSCNLGAQQAAGDYILLLNNDTVPLDGWLPALLETFVTQPRAGGVGAKLLYADGVLQEAGGLVWEDGSGWNWGKFEAAENPKYTYLRETDYCSAACLAIPRPVWRELGGFDERYVPAYYEDTDLCLRLQERGYKVLYQPRAKLVHFEGVSCGVDEKQGVKKHQAVNLTKFIERWRETLATHGLPTDPERKFLDRKACGSVLVLDACTPTPDRDSGSLDTYETMKIFRSLGYRVVFAPASNFLRWGRYSEDLERLGIEIVHTPYSINPLDLLRERGREFDLVMLYRIETAARHLATVRKFAPQAKIIYDTVDLHFLRAKREASLTGDWEQRAKAAFLKKLELRCAAEADLTIVLSRSELDLIKELAPAAKVRHLPIMREIPGRREKFAARKDLGFIGGFAHPPNGDALCYFIQFIWPRIRDTLPSADFLIVGSGDLPALPGLDDPRIKVLGYVPDLAALMERLRLTVAPLRIGAGIKGKIVSSLSHGVPCVATSIAAEGMGLEGGKEILLADDPEMFAELACMAYQDPVLWEKISQSGVEFSLENFSLAAARKKLAHILEELGLPRATGN